MSCISTPWAPSHANYEYNEYQASHDGCMRVIVRLIVWDWVESQSWVGFIPTHSYVKLLVTLRFTVHVTNGLLSDSMFL